jgi:hypothetical protein
MTSTPNQTTADAPPANVNRLLFDLAAAVYRADPNEANFFALLQRKPERDDHASLSEIGYEVARVCGFQGSAIGNLVKALGFEHRLHEGQYFCDKWLDQEPKNKEAHRLAALIACERLDLARARTALAKLEELGAEPGTTRLVKTAIFLAFTDGNDAAIAAREALASSPRDGLAAPAGIDVAFRLGDAQLLVEAYAADPTLNGDKREPMAMKMLRALLVELLAWRRESGNGP